MGAQLLYIEDDPTLGKLTSDMLEKQAFQVSWAQNGIDASHLFRTKTFDIVVADVMMPDKDGYSIVKEIRATNKEIPIIFLSARVLTEDVLKGFEVGANDYLKKPFSIEELVVRIQELLKRSRSYSDSSSYQLGQYNFDTIKMILAHPNGIKVQLTHRECEILKQLVQNRNEIVDRKKALIDLWGDDTFYNARSMDVFITKLRKYLAHDPAISIVNVRARGYKLTIG